MDRFDRDIENIFNFFKNYDTPLGCNLAFHLNHDEDHFLLEAQVPGRMNLNSGFTREELKIEIDANTVHLSGELKTPRNGCTLFEKSFQLYDVDMTQVLFNSFRRKLSLKMEFSVCICLDSSEILDARKFRFSKEYHVVSVKMILISL